jgi:tRNA-2-methylthio-N6-dimethylallyladenosine synthase
MKEPTPPLEDLTFFVRTFGCQMNENDSERISGLLVAAGARKTDKPEKSRVVIVNTCAVRAKAEEKLFSYLGRLHSLKKKRGTIIGVAGCVAQLYREKLFEKSPDLDFVLGPDNYDRLPELLLQKIPKKVVWTRWSSRWREGEPRRFMRESSVSAYITIMEGCDHFCSYCIVPYTRGRMKFRPGRAILEEASDLARRGYKEIQLLGQNVNSYNDPETDLDFASLLASLGRVEGLEWIRFITSHPKNFTEEIARAMAGERKICRQLHLPLQSGSTTVLERMRRGYTREEYFEKVRRIRDLLPETSLSTDIIVGFPGETEQEFEETLTALADIRFSNIFSFRYSPRPRTAAARFADDVHLELKRRRLLEVQGLQKDIQMRIHGGFIGRTIKVLCSGRSKKDPRMFAGRSEGFQVVNFKADRDCLGRMVEVRITDCGPYSLRGEAA